MTGRRQSFCDTKVLTDEEIISSLADKIESLQAQEEAAKPTVIFSSTTSATTVREAEVIAGPTYARVKAALKITE